MIVCLGDLLLDVMIQRGSGPAQESPVEGIDVQPGGSAANVAAWLADQGIAVGFVGAVGQDPAGELLVLDLQRRGVTCAVAPLAVLKRGRAGCSVLANQVRWDWHAEVMTAVEPLGAGDALAAGLIGALHRGTDLPAAVEAGMRLGAQCVGVPGGRPRHVWSSSDG